MKIDTSWHLIEQIAAPLLILDNTGSIQEVNTACLELLKVNSKDMLIGNHLESLVAKDKQEQLLDFLKKAEVGESELFTNLVVNDTAVLSARLIANPVNVPPGNFVVTIDQSSDDECREFNGRNEDINDMKWLADQGRHLLSIKQESEILEYASNALHELLDNTFVLALSKIDEDNLRLENVAGFDKNLLTRVWNLIGGDIIGRLFPIDDRFRETYSKRSLYLHPGGLEEFAITQVPPEVSSKLSQMVGLDKIYTIGLEGNLDVMGCLYIFTLDPDLRINQELVESFTFQVALALEKARYASDLRESKGRIAALYEHAPDAYYLSDLQGNFQDGNIAAEELTGYKKEELVGKNFLQVGLLSNNQLVNAGKLLAQNLLGRSTGPDEFVLSRKDGSQVSVEISTHPIRLDGEMVVLGIARDVTSRANAKQILENAHDTLTRVLEGIDAHVYVADIDSYEILYMNKRMIEDYGGNFSGKKCFKIFRGKDHPCENCSNPMLIDSQGEPGEVFVWEGQNIKTKKWYRNYDRAIYWTDQRLVRMQIAVDMTDIKKNQIELAQSEERYRNLFEKSHNAIMTASPPDWKFTSGNSAMMQLFRLESEKQLLNLQPWQLSPEYQPDQELSQDKAKKMLQIAVEKGSHFFDWTHKRFDGEEFFATVQLTRVDLEDDYFIQATVRDISERVKAEEQIIQQMNDLEIINNLVTAANRGASWQDIFEIFSRAMTSVFGSNNTHIYLLDGEDKLIVENMSPEKDFKQFVERITGVKVPENAEIQLGDDSIYRRLIKQGEAKIITDEQILVGIIQEMIASLLSSGLINQGLNALAPQFLKRSGAKSMAVFPMKISGEHVGLIDVVFPHVLSESDLYRIKVITEQLCGIIQRINSEYARETSIAELEFINQTITDGSRIDDIDEICAHLAKSVKKINPKSYLAVSLYDPDQESIRVRATEGLGKFGDRLFNLLGGKPEEFKVDTRQFELDEELNKLFTSGRLERVPGGLFDLTRGKLSKRLCQSLERMTGVHEVYIAGFSLSGQSSGGLILFLKEGVEIQFPEAIESVVSHYSMIFERRMVQDDVFKRKTQLEALREIEHELTKELDVDVLLQSIADRTRSIVNAGACGISVYNPQRNLLEYKAYSGFEELPENTDIYPGKGLSGRVFVERDVIVVEHYASWEYRIEDWVPVGDYYLAGIPVSWGDALLGVLEIALSPGESLSPGEISTLELFAAQAAIAIKNAQLFSDEKSRRIEAETLREVGLLINQMINQPDMLDRVLSSLQKIIPYTSASIQLVDGSDVVVEAYQGDRPKTEVIGSRYMIDENTVAKKIIRGGQYIILNNKQEVEEILDDPSPGFIASWLAVPLINKGNQIGILTLDHKLPDQYTDQDASLAAAFASQVVVSIENNRLFRETRRRTKEIEAVYDSALTITKNLQPEILFEDLYKQIDPLFNPDAYILAVNDPSLDMIRVAYAVEGGIRQRQTEEKLISPEDKNSLLGWIVRKKAPLLIGNVAKDSLPFHPPHNTQDICSFLGVPLIIGDRAVGAIVVESYHEDSYSREHQRLLQLLGNQVAIALENSRLFEEARRRLSRLSSLHDIDQAISGSVDLRFTMDLLLKHLRHTLEVDAACVLVYNKDDKTLDYSNAVGFRTTSLQHTSLKIGDGLAGRAAIERNLVHILDLSARETSLQQSPQLSQENFVSYMAQPLIAKGELVGVLEVFQRSKLTPDPEWFNFLGSLSRSAAIAIDRLNLLHSLTQSNIDLKQAYDATIEGWARAIELRDGETEGHSRRVVALTMNLARKMGISGEKLTHMRRGALLHDIGKMAIPDGILLKSGKLTDEEWQIMKTHPKLAYEMLSEINYLKPALEIPYYHHERWDGSGYPEGLAGEDIPLEARIFAVVDVWDALQSDRPYRNAWNEGKTIQYLKDQAGKEFDPHVVAEFLDLIGKK